MQNQAEWHNFFTNMCQYDKTILPMPKRTKKEKIIADYRKRLKLLQNSNVVIKQSSPAVPLSQSEEPKIDEKKPKVIETESDSQTAVYFKKDFRKSLILIAAVIALEISLYFASINNYFKLGR